MQGLVYIGSQDTDTYKYETHFHTLWEITYYYEGEGIDTTAGVPLHFSPGTIICQPPYLEHYDNSEKGYKNIFLTVEHFDLDRREPIVVYDTPKRNFLAVLRIMYDDINENGRTAVTDAMLTVLGEYICRFMRGVYADSNAELIRRRLTENLSNPEYSISEATAGIPMSQNHCRRIFETEYGMPPVKWLRTQRMERAKLLLKTGTHPVCDVGWLCGYSDPYYFSRVFSAYYGMPPSEYRKKVL
jgi:AraC-type DNA-binding domain-containing proteins